MSPRDADLDLAGVIEDDGAFRRWYAASAPRVYAYLYGRTGSLTIAEDLTQETFVEVVRNPHTYDGRPDAIGWLIGIARHRLSRHFRAERGDLDRREAMVRQLVVEAPDGRQLVEERDLLLSALATLPVDHRTALMLRFVDGLPVREVAGILGRSEDAAESLIRRARHGFEKAYLGLDQ